MSLDEQCEALFHFLFLLCLFCENVFLFHLIFQFVLFLLLFLLMLWLLFFCWFLSCTRVNQKRVHMKMSKLLLFLRENVEIRINAESSRGSSYDLLSCSPFFYFFHQFPLVWYIGLIYAMKLIHCDCPTCFELMSISSLLLARLARFEIQNWNGWCVSCTRSDIYEMNTKQTNRSSLSICSMNLNNRYFWGRFYFLSLFELNGCVAGVATSAVAAVAVAVVCCRYRFSLSFCMWERTSRLQLFNTQRKTKTSTKNTNACTRFWRIAGTSKKNTTKSI